MTDAIGRQLPVDERDPGMMARRDLTTSLWLVVACAVIAALFIGLDTRAAGIALSLVCAYRASSSIASLFIARTKIVVGDRTPAELVLMLFKAGEGYPAEYCYLLACRLQGSVPTKEWCPVFPMRMDNVFRTQEDAHKHVNHDLPPHVYSHPIDRRIRFVDDHISPSERAGLVLKTISWIVAGGAGMLLTAIG